MAGHSRRVQTSTRLSREDWIDEALAMCAEVGFDRVAAEPLAVRLGVTKGSFYWHFANRDGLLTALLDRWERTRTRAVIDQLDALRARPAADRLGRLVRSSFERALTDPTEWAILTATHPSVAPVVGRVHAARVGYLSDLFVLTDLPPSRARARARVLYAAYLGHQMLLAQSAGQRDGGDRAEPRLDEAAAAAYLDELIALAAAP